MSEEVRRFFVDALPEEGGDVSLSDDAARHARVLRLGEGDEVVLFDGSGRESRARIVATSPLSCRADAPSPAVPDAPKVHLIQALPKGKKLESIVRMATELGVDAIHFAITERTISRPDDARGRARVERLGRIAQEAARQARRRIVPHIREPRPLLEVSRRASAESIRLVFWENADAGLPKTLDISPEMWVIVGPEGGLSQSEVDALGAEGWSQVHLGSSILRVETAAPVALALVLDRAGRLGR